MNSSVPGWYPDPDNSLQEKYWDGHKWTMSVRSVPDGADAWQNRVSKTNSSNSSEPSNSIYRTNDQSSSGKWLVWIIVGIVALAGFRSCENQGWRMGIDGNGYKVTCQDGTTSMSGGIQGACSHHGGVQ